MNIKCKSCDHVFFVIDEMVGQNVECPNCHEKVLIKAQMSEESNIPNSKRCPNCGLELLPEALFCTNCGAKLFQDNNDKKDMGENKNLEEKCSDLKRKIHTKKNRLLVILCIIFTLILIPIVTSLYKSYQHHKYQKRQQTKIQELYKRQQTKIQELINLEGLEYNYDIHMNVNDIQSLNFKDVFIPILEGAYAGKSTCQFLLGQYYYDGKYYVPQNYKKAYEWFMKAAEYRLRIPLYDSAWWLPVDSPEERHEYRVEFQRYIIGGQQAKALAMDYLGDMYSNGYYVSQNLQTAINYYEAAASLRNTSAMYELGKIYKYGKGVIKNDKTAFNYFYDAAEIGSIRSMTEVGLCYLEGRGTKKNTQEAIKWLTKGAENNNNIAQCALGKIYLNGIGVLRDVTKAKELLNKAKTNGNVEAKHILRELNESE